MSADAIDAGSRDMRRSAFLTCRKCSVTAIDHVKRSEHATFPRFGDGEVERRVTDLQHIALATAAAIVLFRLTGMQVEGSRSPQVKAALNDVARAMSNCVTVYAASGEGEPPQALEPMELMDGSFECGAQAVRRSDGTEITGLTVQRRDMLTAIAILKAANVRFERLS